MDQQTNSPVPQPLNSFIYKTSPRNKKIGLFLLISPFAGVAIAVIIFSISAIINDSTGSVPIVMLLFNWLAWLLGLIGVVMVLPGIVLGIIYLSKRELVVGMRYDERSGKKEESVVPQEIKGWNWGAAGLTWIWGVYHGVWISLLYFIPLVNIVMWIILGIKGNEWAWRTRRWESVESFIASQKKWKPWGIAFFIINIIFLISWILGEQ